MMPAHLRSDDGESLLALGLEQRAEYATEPGFEGSVRFQGQHWDGDHHHSLQVSVNGLWLRFDGLRALCDFVATWLARPLHELTPEYLVGEFQLARLPGQSVIVRLGPRSEVEQTRNPIVTVVLAAGSLSGEYYFPSDQSCLGAFTRELTDALVGIG
jgi:hypothetical protein